MRKVIFKYDLRQDDRTTLVLPDGAKPLYVDQQNGVVRLWIEQEEIPKAAGGIRARAFYTRPTGTPFDLGVLDTYIGTAFTIEGALVWHVYEVFNDYD